MTEDGRLPGRRINKKRYRKLNWAWSAFSWEQNVLIGRGGVEAAAVGN
jgi:hypothetical protein